MLETIPNPQVDAFESFRELLFFKQSLLNRDEPFTPFDHLVDEVDVHGVVANQEQARCIILDPPWRPSADEIPSASLRPRERDKGVAILNEALELPGNERADRCLDDRVVFKLGSYRLQDSRVRVSPFRMRLRQVPRDRERSRSYCAEESQPDPVRDGVSCRHAGPVEGLVIKLESGIIIHGSREPLPILACNQHDDHHYRCSF